MCAVPPDQDPRPGHRARRVLRGAWWRHRIPAAAHQERRDRDGDRVAKPRRNRTLGPELAGATILVEQIRADARSRGIFQGARPIDERQILCAVHAEMDASGNLPIEPARSVHVRLREGVVAASGGFREEQRQRQRIVAVQESACRVRQIRRREWHAQDRASCWITDVDQRCGAAKSGESGRRHPARTWETRGQHSASAAQSSMSASRAASRSRAPDAGHVNVIGTTLSSNNVRTRCGNRRAISSPRRVPYEIPQTFTWRYRSDSRMRS